MQVLTRSLVALVLVATVCLASNPVIGLVTAKGDLEVDKSRVWGNATVFDGSVIQTGEAASHLQLNNGVQMRLANESRAQIYRSRAILERGTGQLQSSNGYEMEAGTLRIMGTAPNSVARVRITGPSSVTIAALTGNLKVTNARGALVARMAAGRELAFDTQAGASAPTKITGILTVKDGRYYVTDETTDVVMEVQGEGLATEVGNTVEVTGSKEGSVLMAVNVKHLSGTAQGAGASGGAAAGSSAAITGAVIGGVAVAGTVGGLAAAGTFSGRGHGHGASR